MSLESEWKYAPDEEEAEESPQPVIPSGPKNWFLLSYEHLKIISTPLAVSMAKKQGRTLAIGNLSNRGLVYLDKLIKKIPLVGATVVGLISGGTISEIRDARGLKEPLPRQSRYTKYMEVEVRGFWKYRSLFVYHIGHESKLFESKDNILCMVKLYEGSLKMFRAPAVSIKSTVVIGKKEFNATRRDCGVCNKLFCYLEADYSINYLELEPFDTVTKNPYDEADAYGYGYQEFTFETNIYRHTFDPVDTANPVPKALTMLGNKLYCLYRDGSKLWEFESDNESCLCILRSITPMEHEKFPKVSELHTIVACNTGLLIAALPQEHLTSSKQTEIKDNSKKNVIILLSKTSLKYLTTLTLPGESAEPEIIDFRTFTLANREYIIPHFFTMSQLLILIYIRGKLTPMAKRSIGETIYPDGINVVQKNRREVEIVLNRWADSLKSRCLVINVKPC